MALAEPDAEETAEPVESEPELTPSPEPEEPAEVIEEPEPEPTPETGTSPIMLVLIGVAVLAVGGLGYYFKIYKPKHELDDAADLDEFEFAIDVFLAGKGKCGLSCRAIVGGALWASRQFAPQCDGYSRSGGLDGCGLSAEDGDV